MESDITIENNKRLNCNNSSPRRDNVQDNGVMNDMETNVPSCPTYEKLKETDTSHAYNKKIHSKHALRQQAKRRRKNTTIAAGNSATLPRIIVKPLPPQTEETPSGGVTPATMREVLASIPGFSIKPRKRSNKKLSTAAQLEQTKEGCIDLETPDSILVNTNLRALLNKHTFSILPPLYQYKLVQLLPNVDRQGMSSQPDVPTRLSTSGLNNEFFARACLEWRERLAEGEFTPENQQKLKSEAEKEKMKLDPWKLKHFEPIWGDKNPVNHVDEHKLLDNPPRPTLKTTIKLRPTTSVSKPIIHKPIRTVGAVTRQITSFRGEINAKLQESENVKSTIPDLIPIKSTTKHIPVRPEVVVPPPPLIEPPEIPETTPEPVTEVDPLHATENSMEFVESKEEVSLPSSFTNVDHVFDIEEQAEEKNELKKSPVDFNIEIAETDKISDTVMDESIPSEKMSQDTPEPDNEPEFKNETNFEYCENENFPTDDAPMVDENVKPEIINEDSLDKPESVSSKQDYFKNVADISDDQVDENQQLNFEESISGLLPSSIILQQEPVLPSNEDIDKIKSSIEHDLDLQLQDQANFEQNVNVNNIESEEETNEVRLMVAEDYVLESGAITNVNLQSDFRISEPQEKTLKEEEAEDIQAAILAAAVSQDEDCCWNVDSSTEKLLEVPLHSLETVPVAMTIVNTEEETNDVAVIPMQEELEVRLEQGTFPIPDDWPYDVKMDTDISATTLETSTNNVVVTETSQISQFPDYQPTNQVKLELEVTLTPEVLPTDNFVTSSVSCTTNNSTPTVTSAVTSKTTVANVIPPTTIVCLPAVVSSASIIPSSANQLTSLAPNNFINTNLNRTAMVASSSAVPYLALSTSQPIRAVPTHSKSKLKSTKELQVSSGNSNRNRNSTNKPPGAVNLERSYQICQAVIQNSPNRDQLRCQLKPPPSLLTTNSVTNKKNESRPTQYGVVSSSRSTNKPFTPPLPAGANFMISGGNGVKHMGPAPKLNTIRSGNCVQRQSSPVLVRHVFTSSQGIPVTMAVLPSAQTTVVPEVSILARIHNG